MKILFALCLGLGILSGCASTKVTQLSGKTYPSKPEDCNLKIMNVFPKDQKYEEIALVRGKAGGSAFHGQEFEDLLPDMKKKACELGADALVLKGSADSSYAQLFIGKRGEATAVAIKLID